MSEYDIYSNFDIKKHKSKYVDYLEVLILENGQIVYAVPSHQMKAEMLAEEKLNVSHEDFLKMCPKEYWFNYLEWVLGIINAIAVWNDFYITGKNGLNKKQRGVLKILKMHGLYKGVTK